MAPPLASWDNMYLQRPCWTRWTDAGGCVLAGYLLGGIAWFAIPFSMATSLGLAARALDLPISLSESNAGGPARLHAPVRKLLLCHYPTITPMLLAAVAACAPLCACRSSDIGKVNAAC
jgi:hypothetical protein